MRVSIKTDAGVLSGLWTRDGVPGSRRYSISVYHPGTGKVTCARIRTQKNGANQGRMATRLREASSEAEKRLAVNDRFRHSGGMSDMPRFYEFREVYLLVGLGGLSFNALAHSSHEGFPISNEDRRVMRVIRALADAEKEGSGPLSAEKIELVRAAKPIVLRVARAWLKQTKQDGHDRPLQRLCDELDGFDI